MIYLWDLLLVYKIKLTSKSKIYILCKITVQNIQSIISFFFISKPVSKIIYSSYLCKIDPEPRKGPCNLFIQYNPLRPGVLLSADLWDITQNRLLTSTDS